MSKLTINLTSTYWFSKFKCHALPAQPRARPAASFARLQSVLPLSFGGAVENGKNRTLRLSVRARWGLLLAEN